MLYWVGLACRSTGAVLNPSVNVMEETSEEVAVAEVAPAALKSLSLQKLINRLKRIKNQRAGLWRTVSYRLFLIF